MQASRLVVVRLGRRDLGVVAHVHQLGRHVGDVGVAQGHGAVGDVEHHEPGGHRVDRGPRVVGEAVLQHQQPRFQFVDFAPARGAERDAAAEGSSLPQDARPRTRAAAVVVRAKRRATRKVISASLDMGRAG